MQEAVPSMRDAKAKSQEGMSKERLSLEKDPEVAVVESRGGRIIDDEVVVVRIDEIGDEQQLEESELGMSSRKRAVFAIVAVLACIAIAVGVFAWMDAQAKQAEADRQFNDAVAEHVATYEEEYEALKPVYDAEAVDDAAADAAAKASYLERDSQATGGMLVEKAYADEAADSDDANVEAINLEEGQKAPDTVEQLADKFVGLEDLRARIEADRDAFKLANGELYNYDELLGKIDSTTGGIQTHVVETWEAELAAANIDPNAEGVTEEQLNENIAKLEALAAQMEAIAPKLGLVSDAAEQANEQVRELNAKIAEVQSTVASTKEAQSTKYNTMKQEREAAEAQANGKGNWWGRLDAPDFDPYTELPAWDGSADVNGNWNHKPNSGDWFYDIGTGEWIRIP